MNGYNPATNAGVHNSTGIEFQKHCALYLLFEKYSTLKNQKYFICLEHHDDFLFCFLTPAQIITSIEAYQSKKASNQWSMGKGISEILKKLTQVGLDLNADTHPKDAAYTHNLRFVTNESIALSCGKKKNPKTALVNAGNNDLKFVMIDIDIQHNILKGLAKQAVTAPEQLAQLDNLSLLYIDLPKTARGQKDGLVGQFHRIFGSQVNDPSAAVDALLLLFRDVENVLNNGSVAKLMDKTKRVDSDVISDAMQIITTKARAYELWRGKGDKISMMLGISVFDESRFRLQFQNSLDLFKDLKQKSHRNVRKYVFDNKARWVSHTDDVTCLGDIYTKFSAERSSNLSDIDLKAAIYAAYVELKG
jgi:hypothetical protein